MITSSLLSPPVPKPKDPLLVSKDNIDDSPSSSSKTKEDADKNNDDKNKKKAPTRRLFPKRPSVDWDRLATYYTMHRKRFQSPVEFLRSPASGPHVSEQDILLFCRALQRHKKKDQPFAFSSSTHNVDTKAKKKKTWRLFSRKSTVSSTPSSSSSSSSSSVTAATTTPTKTAKPTSTLLSPSPSAFLRGYAHDIKRWLSFKPTTTGMIRSNSDALVALESVRAYFEKTQKADKAILQQCQALSRQLESNNHHPQKQQS